MILLKRISILILPVFVSACGSSLVKYEKDKGFKKIDEFEQKVKIEIPADPSESAEDATTTPNPAEQDAIDKIKASQAALKNVVKPTPITKLKVTKTPKRKKGEPAVSPGPTRRQPELESDTGFSGRRPIKDPFRVGEKVVHQVNYFAVSAGTMAIEVKPFAQVNERKSYHFAVSIKTSRWYSGIYSVDDKVSVLMDYETMVPSVYQLAVRETGQVKEARMLFQDNKAMFWERKVTEKHGEEEQKKDWEILEYSQNVFSAAFYMRTFEWQVGQENAFRVADDGENLIFRGKAIRKEKISTDAGDFDAIVIQPQIELKGKFKPVGDIFIWLSDDDRKFILKIESKIKIGTLVSEVIELKP